MTQYEAGKLFQAIIIATKLGRPLPPIPDGVPAQAVKTAQILGTMYLAQEDGWATERFQSALDAL